jgi:hypothetical protein
MQFISLENNFITLVSSKYLLISVPRCSKSAMCHSNAVTSACEVLDRYPSVSEDSLHGSVHTLNRPVKFKVRLWSIGRPDDQARIW